MLVLSRRSLESVVVGRATRLDRLLKVTVLAVRDGKVSLGFEVADDVAVHRLEVWERIRADRLANRQLEAARADRIAAQTVTNPVATDRNKNRKTVEYVGIQSHAARAPDPDPIA